MSRFRKVPDEYLAHLSPLGWEHIRLNGDYIWKPVKPSKGVKLRSLRKSLA